MAKYEFRNLIYIWLLVGIFLSSCNGQPRKMTDAKASPRVIKNFKSAALAPDFDTTLVSQYIRSIFQDSKGNLWFGTLGEGVVRYDQETLTYFSYPDGFYNQTVYAINEDKEGNMWFGTDQGLYKCDPKQAVGKRFKNYGIIKNLANNFVIS